MEEQLVSFEVAKLAKEKRFPQQCTSSSKIYYNNEGKLNVNYYRNSYDRDIDILAPTQSLLQKRLREKHNIILLVYPTVMRRYPHSIWYRVGAKCISKNPCKITYLGISGDYYKSWKTACNEGLKIILERLSNE